MYLSLPSFQVILTLTPNRGRVGECGCRDERRLSLVSHIQHVMGGGERGERVENIVKHTQLVHVSTPISALHVSSRSTLTCCW